MHQMMLEKGFKLKSPEVVAELQKQADDSFNKNMERRKRRENRSRQKLENLKTVLKSGEETSNMDGVGAVIREALKKMEDNGVEITAEKVRKLEQEHNGMAWKGNQEVVDENIDELPEDEQISKEQMRQWKMQQWAKAQEKRKEEENLVVLAGEEL